MTTYQPHTHLIDRTACGQTLVGPVSADPNVVTCPACLPPLVLAGGVDSREQEIRARAITAAAVWISGQVLEDAADKALLYRTADELGGYIRDGSDRNPLDVLTAQLALIGELRGVVRTEATRLGSLLNRETSAAREVLVRLGQHLQELEDQITAPTPGDTP